MFYLLLRLLYEDMNEGKISRFEYSHAIKKIADVHGFKKNGIR